MSDGLVERRLRRTHPDARSDPQGIRSQRTVRSLILALGADGVDLGDRRHPRRSHLRCGPRQPHLPLRQCGRHARCPRPRAAADAFAPVVRRAPPSSCSSRPVRRRCVHALTPLTSVQHHRPVGPRSTTQRRPTQRGTRAARAHRGVAAPSISRKANVGVVQDHCRRGPARSTTSCAPTTNTDRHPRRGDLLQGLEVYTSCGTSPPPVSSR